jgi:hypothetical protein
MKVRSLFDVLILVLRLLSARRYNLGKDFFYEVLAFFLQIAEGAAYEDAKFVGQAHLLLPLPVLPDRASSARRVRSTSSVSNCSLGKSEPRFIRLKPRPIADGDFLFTDVPGVLLFGICGSQGRFFKSITL